MSEEENQEKENLDDINISIIESVDREILELIPPNDKIISYHIANKKKETEPNSKD